MQVIERRRQESQGLSGIRHAACCQQIRNHGSGKVRGGGRALQNRKVPQFRFEDFDLFGISASRLPAHG